MSMDVLFCDGFYITLLYVYMSKYKPLSNWTDNSQKHYTSLAQQDSVWLWRNLGENSLLPDGHYNIVFGFFFH